MVLIKLLNKITMYRLMFYFLLSLFFITTSLSIARFLPYDPLDIFISGIYFGIICNLSNYLFSKLFKAEVNLESASISALILTLIVGPFAFLDNILALTFVGIASMASKYILAIRKKHIFNPAAIAVFLSAIIFQIGASWWIGGVFTLPFIFACGILVLTKIKRFEILAGFFAVFFAGLILSQNFSLKPLLSSPIWFFAFVMLVEPLTSPSTKKLQMLFGGLVAIAYFIIPKVIPSYPYSLETALLVGNLVNFALSPTFNMTLTFVKKEKVAKDTWRFYFETMSKFKFIPGQYLEWTFPHRNPDSRGIRRYFTISSTPREKYIAITMRVAEKGSSFKSALLKMKLGEQITSSSPQGEFILPKDKSIPLAFIAGGIGITPFGSIIRRLLETEEKRDITLFYSNNTPQHIAFKELFDKAKNVGVKTIYRITERDEYIDEKMIKEKLPDYKRRIIYISGPEPMVEAFKKMFSKIKAGDIKTDFFSGYTDTYQKDFT